MTTPAETVARQTRLAIVGVPGPLMAWLHVVARALYQQIYQGAFEEMTLDDDASTQAFLAGDTPRNSLIISHFPRRTFLDHLHANGVPTLIAVESPITCVMQQVSVTGRTYLEAIRPITQSLSLIAAASSNPDTANIHDTHLEVAALEFLSWLTRFVFLCPEHESHALSAATLASLGLEGADTVATSAAKLQTRINDPQAEASIQQSSKQTAQILMDVSEGLVEFIKGADDVEVKWPVDFFYDGNNFTTPAPLIMDISGPARCLYYGPYLHLPEGLWEGRFYFGLSLGANDTHLRIEVYTDQLQGSYLAHARDAGVFVMPIELDITDARQPIQLRLFIDRGEIEGKIGLAYAILKPARGMVSNERAAP